MRKPEVLAPAGDAASLAAALASGADAVYFGLDDGFNARARATNFSLATLGETMAQIHRAGARGYLTLNTLVFEPELAQVESILRQVAASGVDAIIVQDPAVLMLARAICPELELHGSTQLTVSSGGGAAIARELGVTRVVVPRELSVDEIRTLAGETPLELEVFVHGALCVSWSGQCLTSEAWGGRSANRGQCAQSCRMPYDLVVDGVKSELGDVRYLLSPKDLAGARAVPELSAIGVHGLKIEGRQKGPQYVSTAVGGYRRWVDAIARGATEVDEDQIAVDLAAMSLSYTRGFGDGFFAGSDHQTLVEGRFPKHRGVYLGRVARVSGSQVTVTSDDEGRPWTGALATGDRKGPVGTTKVRLPLAGTAAPVTIRPGMGVVFDAGHPEDKHEPGGPVFHVDQRNGATVLGFGNVGPDLARVSPGDRVWITQDPALTRATEKLVAAPPPEGRIALTLEITGRDGSALTVVARAGRLTATASTTSVLSLSKGGGIDEALLRDKLGGLGGTPFRIDTLDARALTPGLHVPVSELKAVRRALVAELTAALDAPPSRAICVGSAIDAVRATIGPVSAREATPRLVPLCRSDEQLDAAIAAGVPEVELDWMEMVGLSRAVARAKDAGLSVSVATMRIEKPGEEALTDRLVKLAPDAVLVRHWGALARLSAHAEHPILHGDFSLNATSSITASWLISRGLETITASFDLDEAQALSLVDTTPRGRVAFVLHHRIPTFHTEHCVYSHLLSQGRDYRSCGRPCEERKIDLRDHLGNAHPVIVDAGCRNTVFNSEPQSGAALVPRLLARGVSRFRIDLVRESGAETRRLLEAYTALVKGETSPEDVFKSLAVRSRIGVAGRRMALLGETAE